MLFLTITWVRKSYARFPTTQIFPLELGALTIVSVNGACLAPVRCCAAAPTDASEACLHTLAGGLIFFEEYKGTKTHELLIIYMGIALMISAMVTIAFCKRRSLP